MAEPEKKEAPSQELGGSKEIQIVPAGGAVITSDMTEKDIEVMERRVLRMAQAHETLRRAALSTTSLADWNDLGGNPYLNEYGCAKIAPLWGICTGEPRMTKTLRKDEKGEILDVECVVMFQLPGGRFMGITGAASSRDPFFSKRKDEKGNPILLPLSEIDQLDVMKKAETNCLNRGLKKITGLSFTWEEIAEITAGRITRDKVVGSGRGVSYSSGAQGGKAKDKDPGKTASSREEIWGQILDMCGGDTASARIMLVSYTSFKGRDGNQVPGKSKIGDVSENAMVILAHKVHDEYRKFKEQAPPPPEPGEKV